MGCNNEDTGLQTELLQLKAERTALKDKIQSLQTDLSKKEDELAAARSKSSGADGDFDKQKSISQFIEKVSALKTELAGDFPGASLRDTVQMPSFDAPLRGEVQIELKTPTGATRIFQWVGMGKLDGNWTFTSRKELASSSERPADSVADLSDTTTEASPEPPPAPAPAPVPARPTPPPSPAPSPNSPPNDIPPGSSLVKEDANGKVWLTPDGRYIIKLNNQ